MLTSEIALFFAALAGLLVASWFHGGHWVRTREFATVRPQKPVRVDHSTPTRFHVEEPVEAPITGVVIELPPIQVVTTSSIDIVRAPESVREHDELVLELAYALNDVFDLQSAAKVTDVRLARETHLHAVWLRNAKIARSRFNKTLAITFEAARRPSCDKALAIVTDIGTTRNPETVHLITPIRRHQWIEAGMVAA